MSSPESDETLNDLLVRIHRHSREAYETLYHRLAHRLYAYFLSLWADRAEAEDLTQETLIRLWEKRRLYLSTPRPEIYIFSIARNLYIDRVRAARTRSEKQVLKASASAEPGAEGELSELQMALFRALHELEPEIREIYLMNRHEGLSYREIASIVGLSVKSIEAKMHRALEVLRKRMAPFLRHSY